MTGDSDNELGTAGESPGPRGPASGENPFRPLRGWASAYEPERSMWTRVRDRIAGLFSKRHGNEKVLAVAEGPSSITDDVAEGLETVESDAVAPLDDVKFPWARPDAETLAPVVEETFSSVDDALPASDDAESGESDAALGSPKAGFFARLFGKRGKTAEVETLEVEVHEDRIEAAAQALEQSGEAQFESFEGKSSDAVESFATVEDALPAPDTLPLIYEPAVDELVEPIAAASTASDAAAVVEEPRTLEIDALEIDALEVKTDEFEIVTIDGTKGGADETVDTMEVERKSFWRDSLIGRFLRVGDTEVEKVGAKEGEAVQASTAFLFAKFGAFYNEVIRFQHQKSEFTAGFATAMMTGATNSGPDAAAEALSRRLSELLELQAAEAKWMGGEAGERYPDAQYGMAALADEIFTYSEWDGRAAWPKYSLEHRIYKMRSAEVELFRRIDRLLKESPDSVVARDLARVYLLVLASGFQGKWRPFGLTRPLSEYRRRLYEYIHGNDALMLYAPDRKVFPDAASRTLEGHAVSRFTAAQRWAAILVFLVVSYTVVAHIAWNRASADLKDVTTRISGNTAGAP